METRLLRRFVCPQCGATAPVVSDSAYLRCASCLMISDYDLGRARRHPDGARAEVLENDFRVRYAAELAGAKQAGDRARWMRAYQARMSKLIHECPSVWPSGVSDPAYRARFVAWQVSHVANITFEPELAECQRAVNLAAQAIRREGTRYLAESLWPMVEAYVLQCRAQDRIAAERGPAAPDDFVPDYLYRVGVSLTAQEWLPSLDEADQPELVRRLGLARELVMPDAGPVRSHCGGCGHALELPGTAGAFACPACAKPLALARGAFDCRACGVVVHVPVGSERAVCPFCGADMHEARAGLAETLRAFDKLERIDAELAELERKLGAPVTGLDILDGEVWRDGQALRLITLRGRYLGGCQEIYWHLHEPSHLSLETTMAWAEVRAKDRGIPVDLIAYREHRDSRVPPADEAELERRLRDMTGGKPAVVVAVPLGPQGIACELDLAGTVVRLVEDRQGERADLCRRWVARRGSSS